MDSSFRTLLVKDSRIGQITDDLTYVVKSGAAQNTFQSFPSTSVSNSSLVFQVQIPSESVVVDRAVLIQSGLTFQLTIGNGLNGSVAVPAGEKAFEYGLTEAFAPFPLTQLQTTATCQINNSASSTNLRDILPQLLRMNESCYMAKHEGTTPSYVDSAYGLYSG